MIVDQSKKQSATAAKLAVLMWAFAAATICFIGATAYAAPHVHLYDPGAEKDGYRVVKLDLKPSADYRSEPLHYPPSTLLASPQLKETVPVYSKRTVLSEDVVIAASKAFNASIGTGKDIRISGTLIYQACDDHQCFLPVDLPVSWVIHVQPFDLVRSPEALQHKE